MTARHPTLPLRRPAHAVEVVAELACTALVAAVFARIATRTGCLSVGAGLVFALILWVGSR